MTADVPRAIVVARRLAGAVLILSLLLVLISIAIAHRLVLEPAGRRRLALRR